MRPWIVYNISCETENCYVNSKSGVNFQVALKRNNTKINCVK